PAGVEDFTPDAWVAAAAWQVGRYGTDEQAQALYKNGSPLQRDAVEAGEEAAWNAGAQDGLTLRVGDGAPGGPGLEWILSGEATRESIERTAGFLHERRKRAGVDHGVTVTFGGDVGITRKILVLEHLLRQSVPVDEQALQATDDHYQLKQARERLETHEPDGQPQAWYVRDLERKAAQRERDEAARIRADRVKKLDALAVHLQQKGSANAGEHFLEAGFMVNAKGEYAYPDPDLPGVRAAWDALAIAQRKEKEADLQKRADAVGYRAQMGQWSQERLHDDPEYQRINREIQADPSLKKMVNAAYQQGVDRAGQEQELQRQQDRKALLKAADGLGRWAEKVGNSAVKQVEIQRKLAELVQRGVGFGVDEKALSKSLQGGREAYRQELARSSSLGMG
ncbi:hypothetical protein JKG47_18715, partial [Acidithiobacillus sp. MC6.1]|nr:hypothetical protein [Acidithiobacillus sp. MC6.1]